MADLIRTMESDLFGGYEWAAEYYEDLSEVPESPDRLAVYRGMMRAYEALEGKANEAMRAADGLVKADEELDDVERAILAPLDAPREKLFQEPNIENAKAFLAVFDGEWIKGAQRASSASASSAAAYGEHAAKQALVADAILAALANSNVIASLGKKTLPAEEVQKHHARAATLYEEVFAILNFRLGTGSLLWKETSQSALYRASAAWRLAGEEARAKRATEIAGAPEGAADLQGRGLRR